MLATATSKIKISRKDTSIVPTMVMVSHRTETMAWVMVQPVSSAIATALGRQLLGPLAVEAQIQQALIGVVIAQGAVLLQDVLQRELAAAVAHALQDGVPVAVGVQVAVDKGLQRGHHLMRVGGGHNAGPQKRNDDREDARHAAHQAALIAVPGTQGDNDNQNNVNNSFHMYRSSFSKQE